jgi:hypothetical protein
VGVAVHVSADGVDVSRNAEFIPAASIDQFAFVTQADRQVLHQIDRVLLLPGITDLIGAPLDIPGPARQGG